MQKLQGVPSTPKINNNHWGGNKKELGNHNQQPPRRQQCPGGELFNPGNNWSQQVHPADLWPHKWWEVPSLSLIWRHRSNIVEGGW